MTTLQLEDHNLGKPTCKKVITNRKNISKKVPQAWFNKETKEWHYNWNGAMMEAEYQGKRIPTQEEWKEIIESFTKVDEDGYFSEPVHTKLGLTLAGFLGCGSWQYYSQWTSGYYWLSSTTTTNSYYVDFYAGGGGIADVNNIGHGFSVRCLKELGKEEDEQSEEVKREVSDYSSLFDEVIEKLKERITKNETENKKIQEAIDLLNNI